MKTFKITAIVHDEGEAVHHLLVPILVDAGFGVESCVVEEAEMEPLQRMEDE